MKEINGGYVPKQVFSYYKEPETNKHDQFDDTTAPAAVEEPTLPFVLSSRSYKQDVAMTTLNGAYAPNQVLDYHSKETIVKNNQFEKEGIQDQEIEITVPHMVSSRFYTADPVFESYNGAYIPNQVFGYFDKELLMAPELAAKQAKDKDQFYEEKIVDNSEYILCEDEAIILTEDNYPVIEG